MVSPNEARPETSTEVKANIPELETSTPQPNSHPQPEEFQAVALEVIHNREQVAPESSTAPAPLTNQATLPQASTPLNRSPLKRLGLKGKATLTAVLLAALPTLTLGSLAYNISATALEQKLTAASLARTESMAAQTNAFMFERYSNIQVVAQFPFAESAMQFPQLKQKGVVLIGGKLFHKP